METEVVCSLPHKVSLLATGAQDNTAKHPKKGVSLIKVYKDSNFLHTKNIHISYSSFIIHSILSFQFVSANNKEVQMLVTAKDKDGHTFDTIESLKFETKVREFKRCKNWLDSLN